MQKQNLENDSPHFNINKELAFQSFFESAPMMMGIADVENDDIRHVSDNEASSQFFGVPSDEMSGRLASELGIPSLALEIWLGHYLEAERTKKPVTFEYKHPDNNGGRYLSVTVSHMGKNPAGYSRFSYIVQDVTEVRMTELESSILLGSKKELHGFFMQAPVALAILTGREHFFTLANPIYEKMVGRKVVGKTLAEAFTKEEGGHFVQLLDNVFKTGVPYKGKEIHLNIPDASGKIKKHWVNLGYYPYTNTNGEIKGIYTIVQDVTEQVETRKDLINEKHKLETIFQESPAVMALWHGRDLVFEKVNPPYKALFSEREMLGRKLLDALPELKGQAFDELILNVLDTGVPYVGHEVLCKIVTEPGGPLEDFYFDFSYIQIKDAEGRPYGVYDHAIDVTERVLSRRALEASKNELEKTINDLRKERDLRDHFVAALSHDLRTPLTAAKMSAQILNRRPDDLVMVHKSTARIIENMNRADSMIRDLLDANLIKAGAKLPLELGECNISNLVSETLDELSTVFGERFRFNADSDIVGRWSCNGIRRILENLCNNAIKYGAQHSPITVSLDTNQDWVVLKVHNEGSPIPLEDQAKLFDPFKRSVAAETSGQKGWGLGLTLVKGISESLEGKVEVESSHKSGTIFTVKLPLG